MNKYFIPRINKTEDLKTINSNEENCFIYKILGSIIDKSNELGDELNKININIEKVMNKYQTKLAESSPKIDILSPMKD